MVSRPGSQLIVEPDTDSPRGGRPRDEAREQAILDAAVALIAEIGYDAMSMEAVASRAGVGKTTIYRRWPGKIELVAEAMRRMHSSPDSEPEFEDTGSLRGDLLALTQDMFDQIRGIDGGLICGLAVAVRSDPELGRLLHEHKRAQRDRIQLLIVSRARSRGEIAESAEPPALIDVAVGSTFFQIMNGKPLDEDFSEYLVDRILIPLTK